MEKGKPEGGRGCRRGRTPHTHTYHWVALLVHIGPLPPPPRPSAAPAVRIGMSPSRTASSRGRASRAPGRWLIQRRGMVHGGGKEGRRGETGVCNRYCRLWFSFPHRMLAKKVQKWLVVPPLVLPPPPKRWLRRINMGINRQHFLSSA